MQINTYEKKQSSNGATIKLLCSVNSTAMSQFGTLPTVATGTNIGQFDSYNFGRKQK